MDFGVWGDDDDTLLNWGLPHNQYQLWPISSSGTGKFKILRGIGRSNCAAEHDSLWTRRHDGSDLHWYHSGILRSSLSGPSIIFIINFINHTNAGNQLLQNGFKHRQRCIPPGDVFSSSIFSSASSSSASKTKTHSAMWCLIVSNIIPLTN